MSGGNAPRSASSSIGAVWVVTLAITVLFILGGVLVGPSVAQGQSGPIRGQGQSSQAEPSPASTAVPRTPDVPAAEVSLAKPDAGANGNSSFRSATAGGYRPRPDSAPVVLVPTATVAPDPGAPRQSTIRVHTVSPAESGPSASRVWPLAPEEYEVSQAFGCVPQLLGYYPVLADCPSSRPSYHNGLDMAAEQGTPIYAAASGWITTAGRDRDSGVANTLIVIEHDGLNEGYATEYYHWIKTFVAVGDYVEAGDLIALVGSVGYSTGPHLHFGVVDAATHQRLDPTRWLASAPDPSAYAATGSSRSPARDAGGGIVVEDYIPTPSPDRD